jgi:hypothetical protein
LQRGHRVPSGGLFQSFSFLNLSGNQVNNKGLQAIRSAILALNGPA